MIYPVRLPPSEIVTGRMNVFSSASTDSGVRFLYNLPVNPHGSHRGVLLHEWRESMRPEICLVEKGVCSAGRENPV